MNKYEGLIPLILQGIGSGLTGFALGILSYTGNLSLKEVFKYALFAAITGGLSFVYFVYADYGDEMYLFSVAVGWSFFFLLKGFTIVLTRFSKFPIKTSESIIKLYKFWSKKK